MRFVFVDRILESDPGKYIKAVKNIRPDEDYFQDHFPGFPVVPGVLLTEMIAQAAGKCLDTERKPRRKAMLAQIRFANFRKWVEPNQAALIQAEIRTNQDQVASASGFIEIDAVKVCTPDLLFTFIPIEKMGADYVDGVHESHLSGMAKKQKLF
jgi:3-hydroxyacyl-[acyl-carrier-protein] dehydratase